jgi:murein DD-endopeptidase MepM/ murein hydrolase activator NlpD
MSPLFSSTPTGPTSHTGPTVGAANVATSTSTSTTTSTTTRRRRSLTAALAIGVVTVLFSMNLSSPAYAEDYPTWADVQAARNSESGKAAEITRISGLIDTLANDTAVANVLSDKMASEYEAAQGEADQANAKLEALQLQVDAAEAVSAASAKQVGQLVALMARGGTDVGLKLFLETQDPDALLYQLGSMSKATETANALLEKAETDKNAAQALTDQATVATDVRAELAETAQGLFDEAAAAASAAEAALAEQQNNEGVLQAQLAVLVEDRAVTEADFATGERLRLEREAAAAAAAAAKAAALQAALAAQAAQAAADRAAAEAARPPVTSNPGSGSGTVTPPATTTPVNTGSGWVKPAYGRITSGFGPRPEKPTAGVNPYHYGTDIGASCNAVVSAATSGTVVYSGWLGTYGNWVLIDHGNGIQTGYAHNNTLLVSVGQKVGVGQSIALVGSTGASTGCHSHFEVRTNGTRINPVPFMSARGVTLG